MFVLLAIITLGIRPITGVSLKEKILKLNELSEYNPVIPLDYNGYRTFIKQRPRNYTFVLMFTALGATRQCDSCSYASEEFYTVAHSYHKDMVKRNKTIYFGSVDVDEAKDVFLELKINQAPVFKIFPSKGKPKDLDKLDITRVGVSAEAMKKWIFQRTGVEIFLIRPSNRKLLLGYLMLLSVCSVFFIIKRDVIYKFFTSRFFGICGFVFVISMMSGQMWNKINEMPLAQATTSGQLMWIHSSAQQQTVLESFIVFIVYAAISLGIILLIKAADTTKKVANRQSMAVIGLGMVVVFFSTFAYMFRLKSRGYPYKLLF